MNVVKRDCSIDIFDKEKIYIAIVKSMSCGNGLKLDIAQKIASEIEQELVEKNVDETNIYEIEDMVFDKLIQHKQRLTAKAYEGYRSVREFQREVSNSTDIDLISLLNGDNEYWKKENSNKNATLVTTQRDYMAGITSKDITDRYLLPPSIIQADNEGIIHFHDKDYFGQKALHNCFHKNTKFLTSQGIKSFGDFRSGDKVQVFDKNGNLREATVKNYGKMSMNKVLFTTPQREKEIICTQNHRWILEDGTVTTNIKVGDKLIGINDTRESIENIKTFRQSEMFSIGFIIGDGCDHGNYTQVRLCGEKIKYKTIFENCGYEIKKINETNDLVATKKIAIKQDFLNGKSWKFLSGADKRFMFLGLYCADGAINANKLCTTDDRVAELIRDISYFDGYYITSETIEKRDTQYKKDSSLIAFRFSIKQPSNLLWRVKSIEKYNNNTEYESWCIEEPITHSFILDGGMITGNCDLINLEDMLQNGTNINEVHIDKPHRFITACTVATQIITAVASSQYGGATITLTHLAPFVRDSYNYYLKKYQKRNLSNEDCILYAKEDTKKEIEDGVQTFNYQINSMSTTNGQSPFLSVFMYLNETEEYKEELAMIIEEFLRQRMVGMKNKVGVYVPQAFPKLLYVLEENNIIEDSKYWYLTKLSAQCTAKCLVPDYISEKKMKELKEGNCFPNMGCRSFLNPYKDENGQYKFYGRFNQGVVTINLVDVALSSEKDLDRFWELLDDRTELCHKALQCRHNRLKGTSSDVAPILWQDGALARLKEHEPIDKLLFAGYSSISLGYAGLYECVKYMTNESQSSKNGHDLGIEVMKFLNKKCDEWKKQENIGYSLYGSPIESTTYKFAKCLKKRFGNDVFIDIDGQDRDYITNSYHIPVFEEIDPFTKLSIELEFQELSLGGAISYIETSNLQDNPQAILTVMKFIYEHIMYAELNTKSDYCQKCGSHNEIKIIEENGKLIWECPNCGNRDESTMNVTRRTCGYIGTNFWNQGRTEEIAERYVHLDNHEYKEGK